jgi:SAM-dependent methyltransferase
MTSVPAPAPSRLPRRLARLGFKLARPLYYRWLFDRSPRWAARVRALELDFGCGDSPQPRDTWEEQYREHGWDFLRQGDEQARYALVACALWRHRPGGAVLDLGCGAGLLRDWLRPLGGGRYVGVDLSREAIVEARARALAGESFVVAAVEDYAPAESFDAVVFNESLYYLDDPIAGARRTIAWLTPGGILLVSMFDTPRAAAIARGLDRRLALRTRWRLSQRRGGWTISVYQPAGQPPG